MIHKKILTLFSLLFFLSCDSPEDQRTTTKNTPEALEEKTLVEYSSNRGYGDLVDDLYDELLDKTPDLKNLEENISKVQDSKQDSLSRYSNFNNKNEQYYSSAESHLKKISDSLLRQQIKSILENSRRNYQLSTVKHNSLIKTLNERTATLMDLHIILKLSKTIPLIEDYQKTNLPDTKSIENILNDYNKTIQKTESLIKQNGNNQ